MNSQFTNLMSLGQWAKLALFDPYHVAGFCIGNKKRGCDCTSKTFAERTGQNAFLSRAEISQAIAVAERMVRDELGYWSAPVEHIEEDYKYPDDHEARRSYTIQPRLARPTMATMDGKSFKSITLHNSYVRKVGVYTTVASVETAPLKISSNKMHFTATATLPASPSTGDEYKVYFHPDDIPEGDLQANWEVRGLTVTETDTVLSIAGDSYLLLNPCLRDGYNWECVAQDELKSYVSKLTIVQRRFDDTVHGSLQWGTQPCVSSTNGCNDTYTNGLCLQLDDDRYTNPIVRPMPKNYDSNAAQWVSYNYQTAPQWVVVNYVSGVPLVNGLVDMRYARPIYLLSASLLNGLAPSCGCMGSTAAESLSMLADVEKTALKNRVLELPEYEGYDTRSLATKKQIESNWGAKLGAVRAWRMIQSIRHSNP